MSVAELVAETDLNHLIIKLEDDVNVVDVIEFLYALRDERQADESKARWAD